MPIHTSKLDAQFTIDELAKLFDFKSSSDRCISISTDSRIIEQDQIFLPLRGERFDGHCFINEVLKKGIKFSFCESSKIGEVKQDYRPQLILVSSTLDTYHQIANYYRRKVNPKVIAITGSSGKTTLKDLATEVLSIKYKVHKTEANFNNEIGVPKTILEMPSATEILILEMAMRGKGEIRYLSKTARPDIAVIINIGRAHIGRLGSVKAIVEAKCEVLEYLKKGGIVILYNDPQLVEYANVLHSRDLLEQVPTTFDLDLACGIVFKEGKSIFTFANEEYSINALGASHILNSLCTIQIAKELGLTHSEIQKGLQAFKVPFGRGNVIKLAEDIYLIDETYNANPDSVRVAVDNLINSWEGDYKKVLILGELAELGDHEDKLLKELNQWLTSKPLSNVITFGDKLQQITPATNVRNIDECCAILKKLLRAKTVMLIKGSHVARLDKVVKFLQEIR